MEILAVLDFGGKNIRFERRGDRVWVSLTDMAKATGKLIGHWMRLDGTKDYIARLESIIQIRIIESKVGNTAITQRGTWGVEELAIKFACWCNVDFEIWVTQQIKTLMREGIVALPTAHDRLRSAILDRPDPWEALYQKDFCDRAFNWFGAQFYWDYVYKVLTPEEQCKVNALNPPRQGVRADKIHQYLTPEAKTRLTPYIRELVGILNGASSRLTFQLGYERHFNGHDQLTLPGI